MRRTLIALAALGLAATSNAQLWDGNPLPTYAGGGFPDAYFNVEDGSSLTEFDRDTGTEFSLLETGTKPAGIDGAHGWVNAANFAVTLEDGDYGYITYLGKTAGYKNDFGINIGGKNAFGEDNLNPDPYDGSALTLWQGISNVAPALGDQYSFALPSGGPLTLDFWLNSYDQDHGGTYSIFYPETSVPSNTGLPDFDYSALGKIFNVNDSYTGQNRSVLVIAIEDWRTFDADFTDMFFAIEVYDRDGTPQFPVPEPSTYGLLGAMALMGLVAIRRFKRSS